MKKPRHTVSDHALLRYMERAMQLDVEALRRELGHRIDQATGDLTGMNAVIVDGVRFALGDNDVVTTAWQQNNPRPGPRRPRRQRAEE